MVESVRVLGKGRIYASIEKLFNWEPEKGLINVSTQKWKNPGEYQEKVDSMRLSKNCSDVYRKRFQWMRAPKMEESRWVPKKSRIRASIEKLFEWVPEKGPIIVSTEKWSNPCEYREKVESVRVSQNYSGGYRKRVKLVLVPKNVRIRASTGIR